MKTPGVTLEIVREKIKQDMETIKAKGYSIKFNGYCGMWQVSHTEIGACIAEFKSGLDALEYCLKG